MERSFIPNAILMILWDYIGRTMRKRSLKIGQDNVRNEEAVEKMRINFEKNVVIDDCLTFLN